MEYYIQKGKETAKCIYPSASYSATALEWVGEDGVVRIPEENTKVFQMPFPFTAAGKTYLKLSQLCATADGTKNWCKDIYGREVLCLQERFPCFDSEDFLNETRYYRWYFIREEGRLTRIFYADRTKSVTVTEDVRFLEDKCFREMQELQYLMP